MATHYGTLRDYRFSDKDADDIRGSDVYGINDQNLGEIDDVIFDHASGDIRYVVIDAGGWLSSKKFLVPADRLNPSAKHDDDYEVNLTKDQIKTFPPYDEDAVSDSDGWNKYETSYKSGWTTTGDVQHRGDAPDKNLTPTTDEMIAAGTTSRSGLRDVGSSESEPRKLGERWTNFESRIRRDRAQLTGGCGACRVEPGSVGTATMNRKVG
jgi:sporulation protein YlmC with PRC-barrel domain